MRNEYLYQPQPYLFFIMTTPTKNKASVEDYLHKDFAFCMDLKNPETGEVEHQFRARTSDDVKNCLDKMLSLGATKKHGQEFLDGYEDAVLNAVT